MKNNKQLGKALASFTQVGLSVISPIIACIIIGKFLKDQFGWPDFVIVISIVVGTVSGFVNMITFLLKATRK